MRLCRRLGSFVVLAFTFACQDSTGPERRNGNFVLQRANEQVLPAILYSDPIGSLTVLSSTLTLDMEGHALVSQQYRQVTNGIVDDEAFVRTFDYRLRGKQIVIGSFTRCADACLPNSTGTFAPDGTLTLQGGMIAGNTEFIYVPVAVQQ